MVDGNLKAFSALFPHELFPISYILADIVAVTRAVPAFRVRRKNNQGNRSQTDHATQTASICSDVARQLFA